MVFSLVVLFRCCLVTVLSLSLSMSHWLMRKLPIHRNLQANQWRRGQKYSKWNCWNSGVLRMSLSKATSSSDSVSMMSSNSSPNNSPMVTRNKRSTLSKNLFSSCTSLWGGAWFLTRPSLLLPQPPIGAFFDDAAAAATASFDSFLSMLEVAPLRWRPGSISTLCSFTGVGSTLSEGL